MQPGVTSRTDPGEGKPAGAQVMQPGVTSRTDPGVGKPEA